MYFKDSSLPRNHAVSLGKYVISEVLKDRSTFVFRVRQPKKALIGLFDRQHTKRASSEYEATATSSLQTLLDRAF